ncbi:uncharacterized protein EI97DRAFT_501773 [Westerdykella ornata]|uniref:Uncharacterized protein n=1 Tax=Westerdykella ornata TaxID=318751 RepID=A0A6A6JH48_WESOR|nr:uncharacterized protein EI97DRAFT_501773 [Westerdykella ornata]KAF2275575.1 hypothetical protein EI97DRAFT_501773 [Westerdykella ornata]
MIRFAPCHLQLLPHYHVSLHFNQTVTMVHGKLITTTPEIQTKALKLAPLFPESDAPQVVTGDDRIRWFRYERRETWNKEFDSLIEEIKTIANDIKLAVEQHAGATLRKRKPPEQRPLPMLECLDAGWVMVPVGHAAFLLSVAPANCAEAAVQVWASTRDNQSMAGWLCGSGVVIFGPVSFRTQPAGIPYVSIPLPMSPLGEDE